MNDQKANFKVFISDERFPNLRVYNEGTIKFYVLRGKKDKMVDSFVHFEIADRKEVSITFAKQKAEEFFNYLATHPWLSKAYETKHI